MAMHLDSKHPLCFTS